MELKPVSTIDKRNMKVTFYLSEELFREYRDIQALAKKLNFKVDFSNDFSGWFANQLKEAKNALGNLKKKKI